ncbi:MAG TPA: MogA/MoaB family molybdenum cofactor biosynthesis protein [Acidobacteriaceae bacterium]|nr:MogA/MoaB family molybdenum cofactor biosynthesis protein [Acidobacteriaceae bacterium]
MAGDTAETRALERIPLTAAVITVSDSCARGLRRDRSGEAVQRELRARGFDVVRCAKVEDEPREIEDELRNAAREARLVVTTGGTGVGPRDVTPEATRAVCDRLLEGVAELMRSEGRRETPMAVLSRAVCGTRGTTLILNVPGSPAGALSSLRAALPVLPHALELLSGKTEHEPQTRDNAASQPGSKPGTESAGTMRAGRKVERS